MTTVPIVPVRKFRVTLAYQRYNIDDVIEPTGVLRDDLIRRNWIAELKPEEVGSCKCCRRDFWNKGVAAAEHCPRCEPLCKTKPAPKPAEVLVQTGQIPPLTDDAVQMHRDASVAGRTKRHRGGN